MNAKTIATGGLTAGLLLGAWGIVQDDTGAEPVASEIGALTSDEPLDGIKPIEEVVSFWRTRADASPNGFLDRTQLGIALAALARDTADLARFEESEQVLREALAASPRHLTTQLALAQTLHSQHEFAEARSIAEGVWRREPTSAGALALLGDVGLETGDYAAAEDWYDRLAALERSAPVVSRQSRLAYEAGRPDDAVRLATEALALSEDVPLRAAERSFYHFQLGHFRFRTGDVEGAIEALETALAFDPDSPRALESLAFVAASAGDRERAEALYVQLLDSGPAADLHGSYADLLRARGADADADEQERLGRALAAETIDGFPAERRHLAAFYTTRDPAIAVDLAEADLAQRADVGAHDTLAWALYHASRFDEADARMAQALAAGAVDAELLYHAGAIALAVGDQDRTEEMLAEALAVNPRFHPFDADHAVRLLAEVRAELDR